MTSNSRSVTNNLIHLMTRCTCADSHRIRFICSFDRNLYTSNVSIVMERWRNKVAVVSGASGGIGAACVRALVAAGLTVVGLARRQQLILDIKKELSPALQKQLHAMRCDVTQENNVLDVFKWINNNFGGVDVVINNAGIIATTELSKLKNTKEVLDTIQTNIMGTVYCTREAFNSMRERNVEGHVVIVNSVAGQQVPNLGPTLPSLNIYPATKFALRAMNEIYRQEFQRHNTKVRVTNIAPGIVNTDILPTDIQKAVREFMPMLDPADVADAILWAISTPPNVQVHNIIIKPMGEKF